MSLTKREKIALTKFVKAYTKEMDKVLGKRPVDLKIKSLSEVTPSVLPKIEIETEFDRQLKKHNPYIHVPKIGY